MEHELGPRRGSSQLPTRHTLAPRDPNQASQLMLSQTSGNPGTPEGLGVQPKFSNHHDEPYGPDLGQQPGRPAISSGGEHRQAPSERNFVKIVATSVSNRRGVWRLGGKTPLRIGCGREKENDMSSDNLRDREIAAASARRQALAHTLMVERFGRPQQDRTEAARDLGPDDSGGVDSAGRPDGRSDPRPPRRKYRGWTLASRRSQ